MGWGEVKLEEVRRSAFEWSANDDGTEGDLNMMDAPLPPQFNFRSPLHSLDVSLLQ